MMAAARASAWFPWDAARIVASVDFEDELRLLLFVMFQQWRRHQRRVRPLESSSGGLVVSRVGWWVLVASYARWVQWYGSLRSGVAGAPPCWG